MLIFSKHFYYKLKYGKLALMIKGKFISKKTGIVSTVCGVVANLVLSILKFFIAVATNSVIIFYDAINNLLDTFSSITGAIGFSVRDNKPTKNFPYGFGRIESLISFVISFITMAFAVMFMYHSVERIVYPLPVFFGWVYFGLLCLTTFIKICMGLFYYILYKKNNSDIMLSLTQDNILDSVISGSTVVCYGLTIVNDTMIDAVFALIIGIVIFVFAVINFIQQIKALLGSSLNIDINKVRDELIKEEIFKSIDKIRLSDFGKDNVELYVLGEMNENKGQDLKDFAKEKNIKIYMIEEELYEE